MTIWSILGVHSDLLFIFIYEVREFGQPMVKKNLEPSIQEHRKDSNFYVVSICFHGFPLFPCTDYLYLVKKS